MDALIITSTIKKPVMRYKHVLKRLVTIIFILIVGLSDGVAQYDPSFSHYFDMEPSFNPAAVGKQSKLNVTGVYSLALAGFEHNPRTMYVGADMPFYFIKGYHGAGIQLMNDQLGMFTHQKLALQYAYKRQLWGGTISAGLQVGILSEKFNATDLDLADNSDPAFPHADVTGTGIDIGLGLYYLHNTWYVGASIQHVSAPLINLGETNELQIDRTYYLTAGYNIKLRNPFLTIHPTVFLRTDGTSWRGDITARLIYTNGNKVMYGGVGYSPTNSITALIGGSFHGIIIGYSYEFYTSGISIANGSHELFVGYQTDINLIKKGKNKHKSVRIL